MPGILGTVESWFAFVVAAYLAGHLPFLIGSSLDSLLYDPARKLLVPPSRDHAYTRATEIMPAELRGSRSVMNTFQWARATLQLLAPAAIADTQRYEADSKFFRSFAVALYVVFALLLWRDARPWELGVAVALFLLLAASKLARNRTARARRRRRQNEERQRSMGASSAADSEEAAIRRREVKRIAQVALPLLAVLFGLLLYSRQVQALFLLALLVLSLWRYGERRWKSVQTTYYYAIVRAGLPPLPAAAPGAAPP